MADIKIEKKAPVWPWVLVVILIILALLYFFVWADNDMNNTVVNDATVSDTLNNTAEMDEMAIYNEDDAAYGGVVGYVAYVENESKMGIDHLYTNRALLYLADALDETATTHNLDVSADLQTIREHAEYVTRNSEATDHSEHIKTAGTAVVGILRQLQTENFPDLENEVKDVEKAVTEIDPKVLTLDQKEAVKTFYKQAAEVLDKMD